MQFCFAEDNATEACCLTVLVYDDKAICVGYKPPKVSWEFVKNKFNNMLTVAFGAKNKVLVMGDFNVGFLKNKNSELFQMFKKF